jgi:hypothetical protein
MTKLFHVLSLGLCILAVPALTRADPIVVNGSFEADPFSGSGTLGLGCGNTLTGWTTQCSSDLTYPWGLKNGNVYNGGPTPYGNQWVIVGDFGNGGSWIQQTVSGFIPGQIYTLSFALASEGTSGSEVQVLFPSGSSTGSQIFTAPLRGANFWDTWGTFSEDFTATASDVAIRFVGLADGSALDAGIDNVSISSLQAVPEPTSLFLFGTGLICVGALRRRKQRAQSARL